MSLLGKDKLASICDKEIVIERNRRLTELEQLLVSYFDLPLADIKRKAKDVAMTTMKLDLEDQIELTYYSIQKKHNYISQMAGRS